MSERAIKYLASLERITPTPIGVVEQLFEDEGLVPAQSWLDFHEKYAGYIEGWNPDPIVWGLCHEEDRQWPRRTLVYNRWYPTRKGNNAEPMSVVCAHLGHDLCDLFRDGEFVGHPWKSENFEIKVEQTAIEKSFYAPGTRRVREVNGQSVFEQIEALQTEMADYLVPEASDKYVKYYLNEVRLLIVPLTGIRLSERDV